MKFFSSHSRDTVASPMRPIFRDEKHFFGEGWGPNLADLARPRIPEKAAGISGKSPVVDAGYVVNGLNILYVPGGIGKLAHEDEKKPMTRINK